MEQRALSVRLTEKELAVIKSLATRSGVSQSVIVRGLIRKELIKLTTKRVKDVELFKLIKLGDL